MGAQAAEAQGASDGISNIWTDRPGDNSGSNRVSTQGKLIDTEAAPLPEPEDDEKTNSNLPGSGTRTDDPGRAGDTSEQRSKLADVPVGADEAGVVEPETETELPEPETESENSPVRIEILTSENERPRLSLVRKTDPQEAKDLDAILTSENTILTRENKRRGRKKKVNGLPDFGDYHYWKTGSKNGFALEFRPPVKNLRGEIQDYDYHYVGFWNTSDWERIKGALNEQEIREQVRIIIESKRLISAFRNRLNSGTRKKLRSA